MDHKDASQSTDGSETHLFRLTSSHLRSSQFPAWWLGAVLEPLATGVTPEQASTYSRLPDVARRRGGCRLAHPNVGLFTHCLLILFLASSQYSGLISIPIYRRPNWSATKPVVPAPKNGSSTTSPGREPAKIHGRTRSGGNVAKWAPLNGFGVIDHTDRLLRLSLAPQFQ